LPDTAADELLIGAQDGIFELEQEVSMPLPSLEVGEH
jgi:hypothetical protein